MSYPGPVQSSSRFALWHAKAAAAILITAVISQMSATTEAATPAVCGSRPDLLAQLSKKYSEVPIALGLTSNGSLVEVLTSDRGSTWTIMISQPNGSSCLMAVGEGWEEIKHVAGGERGA